jgi:DNA polymerase-1
MTSNIALYGPPSDHRKAPGAACGRCPLFSKRAAAPSFSEDPRLSLVGIGPGANEARTGKCFVGQSGRLLMHMLEQAGLTRDQVHLNNAVLCRPPNDDPPAEAIERCRPRLWKELQEANAPVVALGNIAAKLLVPEGTTLRGITKERGRRIPHPDLGLDIHLIYHPAYPLRNPQVAGTMLADLKRILGATGVDRRPVKYAEVYDADEACRVLAFLEGQTTIVCDLETSGLDPYTGDFILCVAFSWDEEKAVILAGACLDDPDVHAAMRHLFKKPGITWIGHNFKFDWHFLMDHFGAAPEQYDDTMLLHYLADEAKGTHGLKYLAQQLLGVENWEEGIEAHLPHKKASYSYIPKPILHEYAAKDVAYNMRVYPIIRQQVAQEGAVGQAYDRVLRRVLPAFQRLERNGILVDWDGRDRLADQCEEARQELEEELQELTGKPDFNPRSPKQIAKVLISIFGEDYSPVRTDTGAPSTAALVLETLARKHTDEPFPFKLVKHRHASKALGYIKNWHKWRDPDGRVHPSFMFHATDTGRLSESNMGMMLQPRASGLIRTTHGAGTVAGDASPAELKLSLKNEWAMQLRFLFIARPGYLIAGADYSQAELAIAAILSRCEGLQKMFAEGDDIHSATADLLFGAHGIEERYIAKTFSFGVIYGRTVRNIAASAGWTMPVAQKWLDEYFNRFPELKDYIAQQHEQMLRDRYVESWFGRRRRFPVVTQKNLHHLKNSAVNTPIQSTSSDMTALALAEIVERLDDGDTFLAVNFLHDGAYFEFREDRQAEVVPIIHDSMLAVPEREFDGYIKFKADVKVARSWGDLEADE